MQANLAELIELARQGSPKAIAQLLNQALRPKGITTKVSREQGRLTIFADATEVPDQNSLVGLIHKGIRDLKTTSISSIKIYGRKIGDPTSGWREEIIVKAEMPVKQMGGQAPKGKGTGVSPEKVLAQISSRLDKLQQSIRKIQISKRVVIASVSFLLLALVAYGGITGFNLFQTRSAQAQTIDKAKTLVVEADTSKASGIEALKTSADKLQQARDLLRGIPNTPGSLHAEAQAELAKVRSQLDTVEQRISTEEATSKSWEAADYAAQEAISSVKNPPHPLKTWKAAKENLEKAITQMTAIPEGTFLSGQVKEKLANYRKQSTGITQAMASEDKATQTLQAADDLANQAMNMTSGKYDFELSDLQGAQAMWQKAIVQLKKVPANSNAAQGAERRMSAYTSNVKEIVDGIKKMQDCLKQDAVFRSSCGYVSLSLQNPSETASNSSSDNP